MSLHSDQETVDWRNIPPSQWRRSGDVWGVDRNHPFTAVPGFVEEAARELGFEISQVYGTPWLVSEWSTEKVERAEAIALYDPNHDHESRLFL